jgi:hypothetical protein
VFRSTSNSARRPIFSNKRFSNAAAVRVLPVPVAISTSILCRSLAISRHTVSLMQAPITARNSPVDRNIQRVAADMLRL